MHAPMAISVSMPMLAALAAGVMLALLGLSYKVAESTGCRPLPFTALMSLTAAGIAAVPACLEQAAWHEPRLWLLGAGMGLMLCGAIQLMISVNRLGSASVAWCVSNLALLVPILMSSAFLGEKLRPVHGLLLALFGAMLLAFTKGSAGEGGMRTERRTAFWLLLGLLFLANGLLSFGFKLKAAIYPAGSSGALALIYFGTTAAAALGAELVRSGGVRFTRAEWRAGLMAGASCSLGNLLLLVAARAPAVLVFPLAQSLSLLGGVALIAIVYKERFNAAEWVGMALGLGVLVLALLTG